MTEQQELAWLRLFYSKFGPKDRPAMGDALGAARFRVVVAMRFEDRPWAARMARKVTEPVRGPVVLPKLDLHPCDTPDGKCINSRLCNLEDRCIQPSKGGS